MARSRFSVTVLAAAQGFSGRATNLKTLAADFYRGELRDRGFLSSKSAVCATLAIVALALTSCSGASGSITDNSRVESQPAPEKTDSRPTPAQSTARHCGLPNDRWYWAVPTDVLSDGTWAADLVLMSNNPCDVWVYFENTRNGKLQDEVAISLFSSRTMRAKEIAERRSQDPFYPQGGIARLGRTITSTGLTVESRSHFGDCWYDLGSGISVRDSAGKVMVDKAVLFLAPRPAFYPQLECEEEPESAFTSKLVFLSGDINRLYSLADGTFLLVNDDAGVIRFTTSLTTDAALRDQIVLVDRGQLNSFLDHYPSAYDRMPKVYADLIDKFFSHSRED